MVEGYRERSKLRSTRNFYTGREFRQATRMLTALRIAQTFQNTLAGSSHQNSAHSTCSKPQNDTTQTSERRYGMPAA